MTGGFGLRASAPAASVGAAAWLAALLFGLLTACSPPPPLLPIPPTRVEAFEPAVQSTIAKARSNVDALSASHADRKQLADAYGELALRYHAHDIAAPAEAAYKNAIALAPDDKRWPYLLGHLYNDTARQADAIASFEAALRIDRNDVPLLSSLATVSLQHGDLERAQTLYERMLGSTAGRAAALAGLGKVAMARKDYKTAIERFEEALRLWPAASKLRAPLATAYRAVGATAKAEEALRGYAASGGEPSVPDPLADLLDSKVASSRGLLRRGQRFGRAGQFEQAAAAFQAAVEANPRDPEALANLGISLANLGKLGPAEKALAEALRLDGGNALAHLSLGVVFDRQGRDADAIGEYRAAIERDPKATQAPVYLADAEMRVGRYAEAAGHYREALKLEPSARVQFSLVLAEVARGRYREAKAELEAALAQTPGNPAMTNALARLLASAPDDGVRDGKRALELAKPLFESLKRPEVGQTYAMAMAENRDFEHAVKLQAETVIAYERMGVAQAKPFLERNLARYREGKPAREPWPKDDPLFQPRSPAVSRSQRHRPGASRGPTEGKP